MSETFVHSTKLKMMHFESRRGEQVHFFASLLDTDEDQGKGNKKVEKESLKENHKRVSTKLKQAGTELGQAQLKLELELCFTSFKICCIYLI